MKRVIMIGEEPKEENGIEFTHFLNVDEWSIDFIYNPSDMSTIHSFTDLNGCTIFLCVSRGGDKKLIYKGHLNNGTY